MGKTHFTDGLNCYTITNNYMEKNGLRVSHGKNPSHRRIKLLYHYKQLHGEKWLTRKPWEKPISQTD